MSLQFTDQNFKTETSKGFAIVDFSASWCGPCKMMAPIFDALAHQFEGKIKMGKIDVDDGVATASTFGISGVPTLIFFKDGKEEARLVGFQSKDALIEKITEIFGVK